MNSPEIIIVPALFTMIGFVVWTVVTGAQRREQVKRMAEFNSRLLDKLGSVKDFNDLLQTDAGVRLVGGVTAERAMTPARERILRAVQMGIVFASVGAGFLYLASTPFAGSRFSTDSQEALLIFGVIGLSLGIGLLVSSGASYVLARSLGVLGGESSNS